MDGLTSFFTYVSDNLDFILEETWAHTWIVLRVVILATIFSVTLGILVQRNSVARSITLSITGIFLTIPSLALFAFFIPITGTGNLPAMLALFLYAQLPIMRNTVTGLDSVSPAIVESAKGMGMNNLQQLTRVRLPLALPVIMAGVRVSTLLTVSITAIAVLVGGDGLGSLIFGGLTRLGLPNSENSVWAGILFTVALGLTLDLILATFQRLATSRGLRI